MSEIFHRKVKGEKRKKKITQPGLFVYVLSLAVFNNDSYVVEETGVVHTVKRTGCLALC